MLTAASDKIDLAVADAQTFTEDLVAAVTQKARSNTLTESPEGNPVVRRRRHQS